MDSVNQIWIYNVDTSELGQSQEFFGIGIKTVFSTKNLVIMVLSKPCPLEFGSIVLEKISIALDIYLVLTLISILEVFASKWSGKTNSNSI